MPRTINLRIFKNEQLIDSRSFSRDVIKIGKLRSSDLFLEDDTVARMHAVLEVTDSDVRLIDLGSATGIAKNGERVHKSAAIGQGDSLCVGPYRLEVDVLAPTAAMATTPVATPGLAVAPALAPAPASAPAAPRASLPIDTSEVERPDHHVAEVIASYGSTILDVQHVGQVRGRSKQAPAWMALGGLLLLAGSGIVANEVMQDWEGYQAAREDALVAGRAMPEAPGTGLGGLGVALALMGLVPLGLGLVRREDTGLESYTLGETHDANFHVPADGLPAGEAFPLVRHEGDGYVLQIAPSMRGRITSQGHSHDLRELVAAGHGTAMGSSHALALPPGARAEVEHAGVRYQISSVAAGRALAKKNEADKPFWVYNAASFAVLGGLLALVHLVPEDALSLTLDESVAENRYVGYMHQPDEQQEEEEIVTVEETDVQEEAGGQGQRHAGAEGKMGDTKSPNKSGLYAMKGPKNAVPQIARNFDPEMQARQAGILGMMAEDSGHFLSSPFGGAFAQGNDDEDVWGGLTGTQVGTAFGMGGMGLVGTGRGGGGTGEGTIGLGNVGTIGKGGGFGDNAGYGGGSGTGFGPKKNRKPQVRAGTITAKNVIDKDIIRRIIRNHHNEVRHCYNQGLAKDPNLRGRVAIMFSIGPTGIVPSAAVSENTTGDTNVGNCVAKAVKRWKFPKPAHGGSAMVTYPFIFSPG